MKLLLLLQAEEASLERSNKHDEQIRVIVKLLFRHSWKHRSSLLLYSPVFMEVEDVNHKGRIKYNRRF